MKNYFFLRHFETRSNHDYRLSGCEIGIPVLETHPISCEVAIDAIFCSTALRCRQTASVFLASHPVQNVFYSNLLLERNLGLLQGKLRTEAVKEYPNIFEGNQLNVLATPPNGEDYVTFSQRAVEAKNWIEQNSNNFCNILICSHNQFLKMLFILLNGKTISEVDWHSITFPFGEIIPIDSYKTMGGLFK